MFKIKKYVYRVLTVALALLVMLNTSAIGVLAESNGSVEAMPGPGDYAFEEKTGTITGLSLKYLDSLNEEQKQNIRLVIPEKINGIKVAAIGDSAFSKYYKNDGYDFASLDLSKATSLESIGTVSYTHLDGYKRQVVDKTWNGYFDRLKFDATDYMEEAVSPFEGFAVRIYQNGKLLDTLKIKRGAKL